MDLLLPVLVYLHLRNCTKRPYVFVTVPSEGGAQRLLQVLIAMLVLRNGLNVSGMMA